MQSNVALTYLSELFVVGLIACLPVLLLTMLIGLLVSIFQVVTQIQEMSLTFVPKLVVATITLIVSGPWMLSKITQFTIKLWQDIPNLI